MAPTTGNKIAKKSNVKKRAIVSSSASKKTSKPAFKSNPKQTAALTKVAHKSAANAIRASKALGLSITYMEKGILYKEQANGTKKIIAQKVPAKKTAIKYKKGMILHAK
jgi:hypothetical protein